MKSRIHRWPTYILDQSEWQTREDIIDAEALREVSARKYSKQPANVASLEEIREAKAQRRSKELYRSPDPIVHTTVNVGDRFEKNGSFVDVHDVKDGLVFCRIWPAGVNDQPMFQGLMKFRFDDFLENVQGAKRKAWK